MISCPRCGGRLVTMWYNDVVCADPVCGQPPPPTASDDLFVVGYTYERGLGHGDWVGRSKDPHCIWLDVSKLQADAVPGYGAPPMTIYRVRIAKDHVSRDDGGGGYHTHSHYGDAEAEYLEIVP